MDWVAVTAFLVLMGGLAAATLFAVTHAGKSSHDKPNKPTSKEA